MNAPIPRNLLSRFPLTGYLLLTIASLEVNLLYPHFLTGYHNTLPFLVIISTSLVTLLLSIPAIFMDTAGRRWWFGVWIVLTVILAEIEIYSLTQFHQKYGPQLAMIVLTTRGLWMSWIRACISLALVWKMLLGLVAVLAVSALSAYTVKRYVPRKVTLVMAAVAAGLGLLWSVVPLPSAQEIAASEATVWARLLTAYPKALPAKKVIRRLVEINARELASGSAEQTFADCPDIVLVIGESHAAHHTSAYGYERPTTPCLDERLRREPERTVLFTDVASAWDCTYDAMRSVFTIGGSRKFGEAPLFPTVFRTAGFRTECIDNQIVDEYDLGFDFMNDAELQQILYDRPAHVMPAGTLDGSVLDSVPNFFRGASLTVLHLYGAHVPYRYRYPNEPKYEVFTPDDSGYNADMATYDNAIRYTDMVVDSLITMLADGNVCVVYFSDHGQVMFAEGNQYLHGNALLLRHWEYVLQVPMFVWCSERYAQCHPDVVEALKANADKPVTTDNISQTLFSLAGLRTHRLDSAQSLASPTFVPPVPRIVLDRYDYITHRRVR